ncbi:MAG: DUF5807 family protein [Halobacteriaceae archaeon]
MTAREEFLSGERPEDIAFYLSQSIVDDQDPLLNAGGESVSGGIVLIVPGETGRDAFKTATDIDPMALAREAMDTTGNVDHELTGGSCPDSECDGEPKFIFAFLEKQTSETGGLYAEGDVVHGYAACECGISYSERWLAND